MKHQANHLEVRPVHTRAVSSHGLFGKVFFKHHMLVDNKWSIKCLHDQFMSMTKLLARRLYCKQMERKALFKSSVRTTHLLRQECRDGRLQLRSLLLGDTQTVRNILQNHKEMQRVFNKISPVHVQDSINQKTFSMRKERDRLQFRMEYLKCTYDTKLKERNNLKLRIKYANEFILNEEIRVLNVKKDIYKSKARLKAIKAIHDTYKKILEILRNDQIFYEPILKSLDLDIQDQQTFIRHILYLGGPALNKYKELSEEVTKVADSSKISIRKSTKDCKQLRQLNESIKQPKSKQLDGSNISLQLEQRYERETPSMLELQNRLEEASDSIKKLKFSTFTSSGVELLSSIKNQRHAMRKMMKRAVEFEAAKDSLAFKKTNANCYTDLLTHNLDVKDHKIMRKTKLLNDKLKKEDNFQEKTLKHIQSLSNVFVIFRFFLWNINEIMHHVSGRTPVAKTYPSKHLLLPLLKFENLSATAVPPQAYEENLFKLLEQATNKLQILTEASKNFPKRPGLNTTQTYCKELIDNLYLNQDSSHSLIQFTEEKIGDNVPNRQQIKMASAQLVEKSKLLLQ